MSQTSAFARAVTVSTAAISPAGATLTAALAFVPERAPLVALTLSCEADGEESVQTVTLHLRPEDLPALRDVLADAVPAFGGAHAG